MLPPTTHHDVPGLAVVISTENVRFALLMGSLLPLTQSLPEGSAVAWHVGVDIPYQLNHAIRRMLAAPKLQWLWIMGDDHTFAPDIVTRLLAHEVDIVAPHCLKRSTPQTTVAYDENGRNIRKFPTGSHGLQSVSAVGSAGMLIRRRVFEVMPDPWFAHSNDERSGEDIRFCNRACELGYPIYVDLDTPLGHITPMVIEPHKAANGEWHVKLSNPLSLEVL